MLRPIRRPRLGGGTAPAVPSRTSDRPVDRVGVRPAMTWTSDWTTSAACRTSDPDALFVQGAEQNRAKAVCLACPVRTECLADALDNRIEFGVWGGMTERERRALLRNNPQVQSWWQLFSVAGASRAATASRAS